MSITRFLTMEGSNINNMKFRNLLAFLVCFYHAFIDLLERYNFDIVGEGGDKCKI